MKNKHTTGMSLCIAVAAAVAFTLSAGSGTNAQAAEQVSPMQTKPKAKPKKPAVKVVNNAHCPVAGSDIGSMGEGTSVTHKGYKVSLCCAGCNTKFKTKPDEYLQIALADSKKQ